MVDEVLDMRSDLLKVDEWMTGWINVVTRYVWVSG